MLSNKAKATLILGGALVAGMIGGLPAWAAYQPSINGFPALATERHLVVRDVNGTRIYEVSESPQTADERAIYVGWLEAQIFDLQKQVNSIQVPKCESEEQVRAEGIASKIAALATRVQAFLAR